jgi:hypothetical protein
MVNVVFALRTVGGPHGLRANPALNDNPTFPDDLDKLIGRQFPDLPLC